MTSNSNVKINHILGYLNKQESLEDLSIVKAFCNCLNPVESCTILETLVCSNNRIKTYILEKVCADITNDFEDVHGEFITSLMDEFPGIHFKDRPTVGHCLTEIAKSSPETECKIIVDFFLNSRLVSIRNMGYRVIATRPTLFKDTILHYWQKHQDLSCCKLILNHAEIEDLISFRFDIIRFLQNGRDISNLYLKISQKDVNLIQELKYINEFSYIYTSAKQGIQIPDNEAKEIIDKNIYDSKIGLIIWPLGKLKMWESIEYAETLIRSKKNQE